MRDHLWTPHGALVSEGLDNNAFLWQPAVTLAKTTSYDEASPINALTKVDGVAQVHDGRGNRTGAAGRTWRYDSRNMLVGANAPGMAASYGYYPEGGRAWKQVNGVTTLYLELDGVEWGTYDAAGTLKERTIRASGAGGAVVAVHSPAGGLIRLLPNRQGSVIGWLRPDGKLGGAYSYDAYGNSAQAGAAGPSFRYAGMRFDAETGLYHTPNRAYDPQDGRWMQLDPIGIKDGLNRYAYVKNSPLMGVDPTGLYTCSETPTTGSRLNTGACKKLDALIDKAKGIAKSIREDKGNSDSNSLDKESIMKSIDAIGEKSQKGIHFTIEPIGAKGAIAQALNGNNIRMDKGFINSGKYPYALIAGKTAESSFLEYGAGIVIHETVHALDYRTGFIRPDEINHNRLVSEVSAYRAQSVKDEYAGLKTGLYAPGVDDLTRLVAVGRAAFNSYLSTLYPERTR